MIMSNLKERMANGETVLGMFLNSGSDVVCEIIGLSGYDFVLIDSEHGPTSPLDNRTLIMAAESRGCVPIVRVPNASSDAILRMLDVGAHGVMVPHINTAEDAAFVAQAARYSPEGFRGVGTGRGADYGFAPNYFKKANERTMVCVQCEDVECVPHLDEIAAVEGVDMIFIGPYDLSSTMGQLGKVSYEYIKDVVAKVLAAAKKHGKFVGILTKDPEEVKMYREMGVQFIICGTDIGVISGAFRNARSQY